MMQVVSFRQRLQKTAVVDETQEEHHGHVQPEDGRMHPGEQDA